METTAESVSINGISAETLETLVVLGVNATAGGILVTQLEFSSGGDVIVSVCPSLSHPSVRRTDGDIYNICPTQCW